MPLHLNNQLRVDELCTLPVLYGRFENRQLLNYDSINNAKRGCFALVFCATDRLTDKKVAFKFFGLDYRWAHEKYKRDSFDREHTIRETLLGAERCLQLKSELRIYPLVVTTAAGPIRAHG